MPQDRDNNILEMKSLTKYFGGVAAVNHVNFCIKRGKIKALIGPNGSGKTTLLNLCSGIYQPDKGEIIFEGRLLTGLKAYEIAGLGIGRTFQSTRLFENMSTVENVMIGRHSLMKSRVLGILFRSRGEEQEEQKVYEKALEKLGLVALESKANELAGSIPLGQKRFVEIARALMLNPKLLVLDEPFSGLNPREGEQMLEIIQQICSQNVSILLVDHHMDFIMDISDEVVVLNYGNKIAEGKPDDIQKNKEVISAYLGEKRTSFAKDGNS